MTDDIAVEIAHPPIVPAYGQPPMFGTFTAAPPPFDPLSIDFGVVDQTSFSQTLNMFETSSLDSEMALL